MTGTVTPILTRQSTAWRYVWCRECGIQYKVQLPVTMLPEQVECKGCLQTGFLRGAPWIR